MLEPNNIYLGDCYELIKQIPDKSIDLIYTDIPYLLEKGGFSKTKLGNRLRKISKELYPIMDGIDYSILDEMCRVSKHVYVYIWCSVKQIRDLLNYFNDKARVNVLVWCKTNPAPMTGDMWLPDVEYCLCFKGKGSPRYNDGYDIKHHYYISKTNKSDKDIYYHPTIKPLELVKRPLKHSTNEGDIVLDPFCGSSTTGIAASLLNRRYLGIDQKLEFLRISKKRRQEIDNAAEHNRGNEQRQKQIRSDKR